MKFYTFPPSKVLSPYIKHYWAIETEPGDEAVKERITPGGSIEVFFHYKKGLEVVRSDGNEYVQPKTFVSGISNTYADVSSDQEIGMVVAVFFPWTASYFFDFPLCQIENSIVSLNELSIPNNTTISEKVSEAATIQKKVSVIDEFLQRRLKNDEPRDIEIIRAGIQKILQSNGQISSLELSQHLAISPKKLERKFAEYVGKSPKQFMKIIRFQNVLISLMQRNYNNLTQLAYDTGYYDQAHFIREFRAYSGYKPRDIISLYGETTHPEI